MTPAHGPSGLAGYVSMTCLVGLGGCDDLACVCRCHDYAGPGEPVCGAMHQVLGVTCNRRPHPPGTKHSRLDGNHVHAWPSSDPPKEEDG